MNLIHLREDGKKWFAWQHFDMEMKIPLILFVARRIIFLLFLYRNSACVYELEFYFDKSKLFSYLVAYFVAMNISLICFLFLNRYTGIQTQFQVRYVAKSFLWSDDRTPYVVWPHKNDLHKTQNEMKFSWSWFDKKCGRKWFCFCIFCSQLKLFSITRNIQYIPIAYRILTLYQSHTYS